MRKLCITAILAFMVGPATAQPAQSDADSDAPADADAQATDEDTQVAKAPEEIIEIIDRAPPGSAHAVDKAALERFERDDIHKVLAQVPGVYFREEDGYGLRPNIGMRGTGSERSAKITLMEDGILIAPAPYSAPAAYYFPMMTRMERIEVVKGPAAIKHGPNTVGGAINLLTKRIPGQREVSLDVAGGGDLYAKGHASYGESTERFGWLIEGVKLRASGFKDLDGGGNTGFDKNDVMAKFRVSSSSDATVYHQLDLKLGYADEVSNETYTGLTDADFDATPYRRYAGTRRDRMDWRHTQAQLAHHVSVQGLVDVTTRVYRHDFERDWRKLNGFNGSVAITDVLANPAAGNNAVYYAILTGAVDSSTASETLRLGTNSRQFVSQGIESIARAERGWLGWTHSLELGTRLHYDSARRVAIEDDYWMMAGDLVADGGASRLENDTTGSTIAWATYYHHKVTAGKWIVSAGARTEVIATEHRDALAPSENADALHLVVLPGAGVVYRPVPSLGLLAGVHRGFVPVSPGQAAGVDAEQSINYEAGARWSERFARLGVSLEGIGFFSNYSNLLGTCTFSSGCMTTQVGEEYNGGRVWTYGLETTAVAEIDAGPIRVPVKASYTFQRSEFRTSFTSSNPQWGDVNKGDEMPYLPQHQLHLEVGVAGSAWDIAIAGRYVSAMRDVAGQGAMAADERTDVAVVIDLAASYSFGSWGKTYITLDNLLDEVHISSRRPFGARPGVPRLVIVGYKNSF